MVWVGSNLSVGKGTAIFAMQLFKVSCKITFQELLKRNSWYKNSYNFYFKLPIMNYEYNIEWIDLFHFWIQG